MKRIEVYILVICILVLAGCNNPKSDNIDSRDKNTLLPVDKNSSDIVPIDLNSEESIKEYLIGEWLANKKAFGDYLYSENDVVCNMIIDESLNVDLSFYNQKLNESVGNYKGKINFDRYHAEANEAPDLISIDLGEADWPGGDYFFLHRTVYSNKQVMSLFFAGNGNGVFDKLEDEEDLNYPLGEIIFEKTTEFKQDIRPIKDSEFYAVFWGDGEDEKSIWMDEVKWEPIGEYEPNPLYPVAMTIYEDDMPGSALYFIEKDMIEYVSLSNKFPGEVYYVKTNKNGEIIELEYAEYKENMEDDQEYNDYDIGDQTYDILTEIVEVQEYIDLGMDVLPTEETTIIDGEECYLIFLGTDSEESFVREIHYAVNVNTEQVYKLDVLKDKWEQLGVG